MVGVGVEIVVVVMVVVMSEADSIRLPRILYISDAPCPTVPLIPPARGGDRASTAY